MHMAKKTIFALCLITLGVISSLLVIFAYANSGGKPAVTVVFLGVAIGLIVVGSVMAFSRLLDRFVSPVIDEIQEDIEDDLQDIKERRMTNTLWMIIPIAIALPVFSFFIFRFHKMEAMWGPIPVVLLTFIGMAVLGWFIPRTAWFKTPIYTPMWIYLIPSIGFIITLGVGLAKTENLAVLRGSPRAVADVNSISTTGYILAETADIGLSGMNLSIPDCDNEGCVVLLVIGLILLVLVLIIGSAMIPHFWLFSGSILLGIMALIAIHDLRVRRAVLKAPD
jgi:hypothetical protein